MSKIVETLEGIKLDSHDKKLKFSHIYHGLSRGCTVAYDKSSQDLAEHIRHVYTSIGDKQGNTDVNCDNMAKSLPDNAIDTFDVSTKKNIQTFDIKWSNATVEGFEKHMTNVIKYQFDIDTQEIEDEYTSSDENNNSEDTSMSENNNTDTTSTDIEPISEDKLGNIKQLGEACLSNIEDKVSTEGAILITDETFADIDFTDMFDSQQEVLESEYGKEEDPEGFFELPESTSEEIPIDEKYDSLAEAIEEEPQGSITQEQKLRFFE